jgi:DNA-directed RNA polymerase specialized sigma24 family protein
LVLQRVHWRAVFDPNAPSTKRAIAEIHDKEVSDKLRRYALWRTGSKADADDLLADAIECVGDPDRRPWDPTQITFFRHMRRVMDGLVIDLARSGRARFEVVSSTLAFDEDTSDPAPSAEDALHKARKLARWKRLGNLLLSKLEDRDPFAKRLYDAACAGAETADEQAAQLRCRPEEVYEALRRLKYRGARILDEDTQAEAARMKALREKAKKKVRK